MTIQIAADDGDFYGLPCDSVKSSNAGGKCVTAGETAPNHTINSTHTAAVATDYYWLPIDANTPRGVKLQLLGKGGVAAYGNYHNSKDDQISWTHWAPLPKRKTE